MCRLIACVRFDCANTLSTIPIFRMMPPIPCDLRPATSDFRTRTAPSEFCTCTCTVLGVPVTRAVTRPTPRHTKRNERSYTTVLYKLLHVLDCRVRVGQMYGTVPKSNAVLLYGWVSQSTHKFCTIVLYRIPPGTRNVVQVLQYHYAYCSYRSTVVYCTPVRKDAPSKAMT